MGIASAFRLRFATFGGRGRSASFGEHVATNEVRSWRKSGLCSRQNLLPKMTRSGHRPDDRLRPRDPNNPSRSGSRQNLPTLFITFL